MVCSRPSLGSFTGGGDRYVHCSKRGHFNTDHLNTKDHLNTRIELGDRDFPDQRILVSKNSYVAKNQTKMPVGVTFWFPVYPTIKQLRRQRQ